LPVPHEDLLGPGRVIVKDYWNIPPYNDEPKFFHLTAELNLDQAAHGFSITTDIDEALGVVGGSSLNKERALGKVAGEAAERFCLLPGDVATKYVAFNSLSRGLAVDPNSISAGMGRSTPDRRSFEIEWVSGFGLKPSRFSWIPSQLVFVPHSFSDDEVIIRPPITTGAAAGMTIEDALYRGLCEVVERDAFMISWLRQLRLTRLRPTRGLTGNESSILQNTLEASLRYKLMPQFFLLPTGVPLFTVLCVLWDFTGIGPAVTVGAKASWNVISATLGSLEEAHQMRPWMRHLLEENSQDTMPNAQLPRTLRERALLWLSKGPVQYLSAWLSQCQEEIEISDSHIGRSQASLGDLVDAIQAQGGTVYAVDLSAKLRRHHQRGPTMNVVKAIVPEYQPLYLTEELRDYSWPRLDSAEKRLRVEALRPSSQMSSVPHPFL
jgi:ribosomal protein S12 methylthiotransferase accessory factor